MLSARSPYRPIQNRSDSTRGELTAQVPAAVFAGGSTAGTPTASARACSVGRTQTSLAATLFNVYAARPAASR